MLRKLKAWIHFIRAVATDDRIPVRTKVILAGMLTWLASPVDLIPDFIPVVGYLDDLIVVTILLDYLCNELPLEVLVDHYPGDAKQLLQMRTRTRWISRCVPRWIKRRLWGSMPPHADADGGEGDNDVP